MSLLRCSYWGSIAAICVVYATLLCGLYNIKGWLPDGNQPLSMFLYVVKDYLKSSTSSAPDALMYDAASVIFLAAYFTKIFVGLR